MKTTIIILVLATALQSQTTIQFIPTVANDTIELHDPFSISTNRKDTTSISKLQFYVSHIQFSRNGHIIYKDTSRAHLITIPDKSLLVFPLKEDYDQLDFLLGIDSLTQVAGPLDGDLDPINGMYWTWQSGYINFKLEGQSTLCNSRKGKFRYHLGGYLDNQYALQHIRINTTNHSVMIALPIDHILQDINLSERHSIMSPSRLAVEASALVAQQLISDER